MPVDEGASATGQPRLTKSLVEEFNIMPGSEIAEESNIFADLVLVSSCFFVCWVHWAFWSGYTEESKLSRGYPQLPTSRHELGDFAAKQDRPAHRPVAAAPGESVTDEGVLLF